LCLWAISIAVALWLTGITSGFTQTENLQIVSAYAEASNNITFVYKTSTYSFYNVSLGTTYKILPYKNNTYPYNLVNGTAAKIIKPLINVSGWLVTIIIKNTGTSAATIDNIFVDNVPVSTAKGVIAYNETGFTINQGDTKTIYIILYNNQTYGYTSGIQLNIRIHSASGRDYPTTITLP